MNETDLPLTTTGKLQKNRLAEFFRDAQPTRGRDGRVCVAHTNDVLGEVPRWHALENALYWIDALKPAVYRFDPARNEVERWTPPEKLGSFAPSAGGGLIIAGRNGFALYDPRDGSFERIADPEDKADENILNDGRCDSRGRFWAGSMTKTMQRASGKLYRVDAAAASMRATTASGCRTASPGARTTRRCISPTATCTRSSLMTTMSIPARSASAACSPTPRTAPASPTAPRSMRMDFSGPRCSTADASRATRRTDGSTAPCRCRSAARPPARSAGRISRTMYVTTARFRLAPDRLAAEPFAGGLLALDVGVQGLPEPLYRAVNHAETREVSSLSTSSNTTSTRCPIAGFSAADQVRGETRALVERDLDHVVGRFGREGRKPGLVHGGPGADRAAPARLLPFDRVREKQNGHTGPGGRCALPHAVQVGSISRCARHPCQNGALSGPMRGRGFSCTLMQSPRQDHASRPRRCPIAARFASAIWLAPALPRNCRVISQIEFQPADMRLRQQAAGGVDRQRAAGRDAPALHERRGLARCRNSRSARARTAPAARTHHRCRSPARRRARRPA